MARWEGPPGPFDKAVLAGLKFALGAALGAVAWFSCFICMFHLVPAPWVAQWTEWKPVHTAVLGAFIAVGGVVGLLWGTRFRKKPWTRPGTSEPGTRQHYKSPLVQEASFKAYVLDELVRAWPRFLLGAFAGSVGFMGHFARHGWQEYSLYFLLGAMLGVGLAVVVVGRYLQAKWRW